MSNAQRVLVIDLSANHPEYETEFVYCLGWLDCNDENLSISMLARDKAQLLALVENLVKRGQVKRVEDRTA